MRLLFALLPLFLVPLLFFFVPGPFSLCLSPADLLFFPQRSQRSRERFPLSLARLPDDLSSAKSLASGRTCHDQKLSALTSAKTFEEHNTLYREFSRAVKKVSLSCTSNVEFLNISSNFLIVFSIKLMVSVGRKVFQSFDDCGRLSSEQLTLQFPTRGHPLWVSTTFDLP